MQKNNKTSKDKAPASRIALCVFAVIVLYVLYVIGASLYAIRKNQAAAGPSGPYGAALAEHDASSAEGPLSDAEKSKFVSDVKAAREKQAVQDIALTAQQSHARAFDQQLAAVWRTIPQGHEPPREFYAGLYDDRFMLEFEKKSATDAAKYGFNGKEAWSTTPFKVVSVDASDTMELHRQFTRLTFNFQPCDEVVSDHAAEDCLTVKDGYRLIEVAYRYRDLTDGERSSLEDGKQETLKELVKYPSDQVFR